MISVLLAVATTVLVSEDDGALLQTFEKLPGVQQTALIGEIESSIRGLHTDLEQTVDHLLSLDEAPKEPIESWRGPVWHDPKEFAPSLAIPRKLLADDDPRTAVAQSRFLKTKITPEIRGSLQYFPGQKKILRLWKKVQPADSLKNYLAGYPPNTDLAREIVLLVLEDDFTWDTQADYFAHAYSDREGNVMPGITLFDVWNSGFEIEMPDIDAIPFARKIMKDFTYKSPIPAGNKRTALYRKIGESFQSYRRYLFLREAAASYFFAYSPKVSSLVEPLRERLQLLIVRHQGEPLLLRKFLRLYPEREEFIRAADELMETMGSDAGLTLKLRKESLEEDHRKIRETTLLILKEKLSR